MHKCVPSGEKAILVIRLDPECDTLEESEWDSLGIAKVAMVAS
jgi:hypothetical protein